MSATTNATGAVKDLSAQLPVYRRRRPGQWALTVVVVLLASAVVQSLVTNPRFGWSTVGAWLFSRTVMTGLLATLELTAAAMAIGLVLGVGLALMRLSDDPVARAVSRLYIWLFRGTPLLVQLLFWGFISALYPTLSLHLPFLPAIGSVPANSVVTTYAAALLGLGLNEAAYLAEIIRAGIVSVDHGQTEAAESLGLSRARTLRRIILPQAMRVIIPPVGNETISMLKTTSLVSVLAYAELLYSVQIVYARTYQTIPLLIVASIWYLAVTTLLNIGQHYLERHFAKGSRR